jgi:hypothetical protein
MGSQYNIGTEWAFFMVFIIGELIVNNTWYPWLKRTIDPSIQADEEKSPKWAGLHPSVFKGVMERGVITICLLSNIPTVLVVFGTIKLGTRLSENKEMKNDYFLIGNLSTILLAVLYCNLVLRIL